MPSTRAKGGCWIFRSEMITELMIILTVVGAGIVIFVWTGSRRRRGENFEQEEVAESTAKFKQELENTANEIIGRMENQATHLENLLDDSERNRTQLEGRIAELKKLIKRSENQSGEVRDLLSRLDGAVEDVDAMKRQIDRTAAKSRRVPAAAPASSASSAAASKKFRAGTGTNCQRTGASCTAFGQNGNTKRRNSTARKSSARR